MKDNMIRAISREGGVAVCALDSCRIVREMERIHQTSAVITAALGRLLTAASLMGSGLKGAQDNLTLRLDGGGAAGVLVAVSDGSANVRGYAAHPVVEIPLRADGKLDVGTAVGTAGTLSVIRSMGLKKPYIGQVPLVSGEIAQDITAYYAASEQTPSVCALGVLVDRDLSVRRAGGFLLQLLPGAPEAVIARIEKNVGAMPSVTDLLEAGGTPEEMAALALEGLPYRIVERRGAAYRCHCSRARTAALLASLGGGEIGAMLAEDPIARVECHFCGKTYAFDLRELAAEMGL